MLKCKCDSAVGKALGTAGGAGFITGAAAFTEGFGTATIVSAIMC